MKLFYNEIGEVVGQVEGATPEIEAGLSMPGYSEVVVDGVVKEVISDPYTRISHADFEVVNDEIILTDFGISLSQVAQPQTPEPQDETQLS